MSWKGFTYIAALALVVLGTFYVLMTPADRFPV